MNDISLDTSLRKRLLRLFTNKPIIVKSNKRLKVIDTSKTQSSTQTSTASDRFTRLHIKQGENTGYRGYLNGDVQFIRRNLYTDYEAMDRDPILSSALDVYADESTVKNAQNELLNIDCEDDEMKHVISNLCYDILNLDHNLWVWVRNLCKYGDFFLYLDVSEQFGVKNVIPLSPYLLNRQDAYDKNEPYAYRFSEDLSGYTSTTNTYIPVHDEKIYQAFEVAHFRLLSDTSFLPYGKSKIENARSIFQQLRLMEDAMMLVRIMRAPERRIFKINVGNIPPEEVDGYIEKIKARMQKTPFVDPDTGEYNIRYNLMNMLEDYIIPVRGDAAQTEIDTLPGMDTQSHLEDVEYLRKKLMSALGIPSAFLGYDEGIEGKCISPETKIPLLDGRTLSARELIEEYESGIKNYVYSIDEETHKIVPGEIEWAGFTRANAQVVRVHLDNGEYIDCTPDHKFMTRDGRWIDAADLPIGVSLMPSTETDLCITLKLVEFLPDHMDTCDLTVKDHHNFATAAGVIIHNSTLAAEDIRFARAIQRIQNVVASEIKKIALVHLYINGYRGKQLGEFDITLNSPSIIYERQKIELLNEQISLATNLMESKLFSRDWIYANLFSFPADATELLKKQVVDDMKNRYRLEQIEREGNDPVKTGESYGTPHDLALLQQQGDIEAEKVESEMEDSEEETRGRPKKVGTHGTHSSTDGRDPLGDKDIHTVATKSADTWHNFKNNDPFGFESLQRHFSKRRALHETFKTDVDDVEEDVNEVFKLDL